MSKRLDQQNKAIAFAAINSALAEKKHAAIRPKVDDPNNARTAAVMVPHGTTMALSDRVNTSMKGAAAQWPDTNGWEVIGSDDCQGAEDLDSTAEMFSDASPYGQFESFDNVDGPGWAQGDPQ